MNKFQKLFRILFNKYCNTIRTNVEENFNAKDEKSKFLNMGEIFKFCKDHNIISSDMLTKDEIQTLVRLINMNKKKQISSKGVINTLDFENFQWFII